jgi:peptidoglycan hydrolase-like protein with peptidoglycan-binding domain
MARCAAEPRGPAARFPLAAGALLLASLAAPLAFAGARQSGGAPAKKPSNPPSAPATKSSTTQQPAKKAPAKKTPVRRARPQAAPTQDRIREIQAALAAAGHSDAAPTGKWDAATVEAMKKFQAANGLHPTGKIDALSLQKLGLGSEVAGAAPPRTPAAQPGTPQ